MTTAAANTYLITRASVMARRLFTSQQLEDLAQTPLDSLGDDFGLGEIITNTPDPALLNRTAERALIHTLMTELSILLRPLDGVSRDLLVHWSRKFELYNLKALIRGKLHGLPFEQIEQDLYDLPALISLPHDQLLRTENVLELLRQLEQGPYHDIAQQARSVYEEKSEPFTLEGAIDRTYYTSLLSRTRRTAQDDWKSLVEVIGALTDQQNLSWLLRYRFNYNMSPSETYYLLIPFGRQLNTETLKELVNLDSFEQVKDALPGHIGELMKEAADLVTVERLLEQETANRVHHTLRHSFSAVSRSLAYLVLREIDLKKLYTIVQGKVLGLSDRLISVAAGMELPQDAADSSGDSHLV